MIIDNWLRDFRQFIPLLDIPFRVTISLALLQIQMLLQYHLVPSILNLVTWMAITMPSFSCAKCRPAEARGLEVLMGNSFECQLDTC